ncbi:MAG: mercury resistance system transport protein MerF [Pseudomonadota bacterium]|nr:mercury resistance system transport protein MerF [Pseudomonadota bacterium]
MKKGNRLIKIGAIGSAIAALCCFTPVLVWLFAVLGLSALVGYLDYVLLPTLAVFLVVLFIGFCQRHRDRSR